MKASSVASLLLAACAYAQAAETVSLHIVGEVDTANHYKSLAIIRQNDTPNKVQAEVPVVDGKVDYVFAASEPDLFELVAKHDLYSQGMWIPMRFMAEDGEIRISGKLDDGLLCMALESASGHLNNQVMAYAAHKDQVYKPRLDSIRALRSQKPFEECLTPEAKAFWADFDALQELLKENPDSFPLRERLNAMYNQRDKMKEERSMYTAEYYALDDAYRGVVLDQFEEDMQAIGSSDNGFYALSLMIDWFQRRDIGSEGKDRVVDAFFRHYQAPYASTIMGRRMEQLAASYELKHAGGRYPDFALPDADGNYHQIMDLIGGKLALVDLWGSTCAPCRVNSKSLKPIYEDYKDKGFEIIGIAREYGNLDRFRNAIESDGYPWTQLIELDDAHGIFNLHGIPNAMGGTFLVSPQGRILLINPTPEELRAFLANWYANA